ncbi:hypothetical protein GCM10023238_19980 [Streptomyces heliomycini]
MIASTLELLRAGALLQVGELVVLRLGAAVVTLGEGLHVIAQRAVGLPQLTVLGLRSWIRSESFSSEASVRMLVPRAVSKLVKKRSPARRRRPR